MLSRCPKCFFFIPGKSDIDTKFFYCRGYCLAAYSMLRGLWPPYQFCKDEVSKTIGHRKLVLQTIQDLVP